jgi:hypothetical protein
VPVTCPSNPRSTTKSVGAASTQAQEGRRNVLRSNTDMLLRLSAGETDLESLLPDRWAASHPKHALQHRLDEFRWSAARQQAERTRGYAARPSRRGHRPTGQNARSRAVELRSGPGAAADNDSERRALTTPQPPARQ